MKSIAIILSSLLTVSAIGQVTKPTTRPRISIGLRVISLGETRDLLSKDQKNLAKELPSLRIGVFVSDVASGDGMDKAGIRFGDIITRIGNQQIKDTDGFLTWSESAEIGKAYSVVFLRSNETKNRLQWKQQAITFNAEKASGELPRWTRTPTTKPTVQDAPTPVAIDRWKEWENEQAKIDPDLRPFELKGDRLGMTLEMFKIKYFRVMPNDPRPAPFCSDDYPDRDN